MTALLRIVGCLWLILVVAGVVVTFALTWIWQGVTTPAPGIPIGVSTALALTAPGLIMVGLAVWLDRRRPRVVPDRRLHR